jgi:hypothetical protein
MRWPAEASWRDGLVTAWRLGVAATELAWARMADHAGEPARAADVDAAWLSRALQDAYPGCRVAAVEVLEANAGTTERARLRVTYREIGQGGLPPTSLFVKLAPRDVPTRLFVDLMRLGGTETRFFGEIAEDLPGERPRAYYASAPARGRSFALLLEDLAARGARFTDASQALGVDEARLVMVRLAVLHAACWETPRFGGDLAWLKSRERNPVYPVERFLCALAVPRGVAGFADLVPAELRAAVPRIIAARDTLEDAWARGPRTLIHGDAHAGNLYFVPGAVGLLDWQVTQRAQGMRDVAYFLANSLPIPVRREHERELIAFYLHSLAEHGVTPPAFDVAWEQYRLHAVYAWIAAAVTAAAATLQQEPIVRAAVERTSIAMLDLDSLAALGA